MLARMTQTTNVRSVWLPGEIKGSRKDSPTAPVTYHADRITAESVSGRPDHLNVCAPVHKRRKEKVEDTRATAPTRLNLAHVRRRVGRGFIWGTCRGNIPRSFSGKNSGNCISTGVVDEAQSPVCTWQSCRATSHAAGDRLTPCVCILSYIWMRCWLFTAVTYVRGRRDGRISPLHLNRDKTELSSFFPATTVVSEMYVFSLR